jgi:hypothetical protein
MPCLTCIAYTGTWQGIFMTSLLQRAACYEVHVNDDST